MAADAHPISYEKAPSLMKWDFLSQDDKIKQQEEWTRFLQEPETLKKLSEACKNIGQTAVAIEGDFKRVKTGFIKLVEKYGRDFPEVGKTYVPRWDGFMTRWSGETGIVWSSRKLAAQTAAALTDYGINLELVADIKTEDDLEGAQLELKDYVNKHPINIATEVEDRSMEFNNDIHNFSKDFTKYVEDQKQMLLESASIEKYRVEISQLDDQIKTATTDLDCCFAFGMLSTVPTNFLTDVMARRNATQQKLDTALANRKGTFDKQMALSATQATFEISKPNIDNITQDFHIFPVIWAFTTEQSTEINVALDEGMKVLTCKKFQVKLNLLKAQIEPLREGMRQYATQTTPPDTSSNME